MGYDFIIEYKKGSYKKAADAFSCVEEEMERNSPTLLTVIKIFSRAVVQVKKITLDSTGTFQMLIHGKRIYLSKGGAINLYQEHSFQHSYIFSLFIFLTGRSGQSNQMVVV